jgi:hypothetical protein
VSKPGPVPALTHLDSIMLLSSPTGFYKGPGGSRNPSLYNPVPGPTGFYRGLVGPGTPPYPNRPLLNQIL